MAVTSFSSSFASRVPKQTVLPKMQEPRDSQQEGGYVGNEDVPPPQPTYPNDVFGSALEGSNFHGSGYSPGSRWTSLNG